MNEGMVLSSYMVNVCQARLPVAIQKVAVGEDGLARGAFRLIE